MPSPKFSKLEASTFWSMTTGPSALRGEQQASCRAAVWAIRTLAPVPLGRSSCHLNSSRTGAMPSPMLKLEAKSMPTGLAFGYALSSLFGDSVHDRARAHPTLVDMLCSLVPSTDE
jgi:hypothetical protein